MNTKTILASLIVILAVSVATTYMTTPQVSATHQPADKIGVAGSAIAEGDETQVVTLLSSTMKTSGPTDLIIQHTQECSLVTDVKLSSTGSSDSSATATENVWIEIDGTPVPVSSIPSPDNGKVVFCDRTFRIATNILTQIQTLCGATATTCAESTFDAYLKTKSTHGFNWVALNVGSGVHTIVVKAKLDSAVLGDGDASVLVGKRTLIVQPVKLANDITI